MKRNTKHEKRLKRLVVTCLLCAIVLTVSTYAWFIGMQTVNIQAFDVKIAGVDSLLLSLDGEKFTDELTINEAVLNVLKDADAVPEGENEEDYIFKGTYTNNTNSWTALEPMSSIGLMNPTTSKMVLYEKGSLTASKGGYRIMAEEVANTADAEVEGYVAFDLFIQNLSGEAYYEDITDPHNEEAIYLTYDSKAITEDAGAIVSGIENSVRVAFAQVGRVKAESSKTAAQSISCTEQTVDGALITPICDTRAAAIWEPNDTKHVANAITWFNKSCKKRTGQAAWGEACDEIKDGKFYKTYAIAGDVNEELEIDVYDGHNGFEADYIIDATGKDVTEEDYHGDNRIVAVDTFTDSEKMQQAENREEIFTLAPNSVTKVRVYIYIEGQDIDNYDFASLGKKIKINFGFTKERYRGVDIDLENPPTHEKGEDQTIYTPAE